jgi:hypothetical protein
MHSPIPLFQFEVWSLPSKAQILEYKFEILECEFKTLEHKIEILEWEFEILEEECGFWIWRLVTGRQGFYFLDWWL